MATIVCGGTSAPGRAVALAIDSIERLRAFWRYGENHPSLFVQRRYIAIIPWGRYQCASTDNRNHACLCVYRGAHGLVPTGTIASLVADEQLSSETDDGS